MSVEHKDKRAIDIWAREIASAGTGMTPGLCGMVGGRPKATPCLKLFSFLYDKEKLPATIQVDSEDEIILPAPIVEEQNVKENESKTENENVELKTGSMTYRLEDLAYGRSGDKGDACNIGIIARKTKYLPYIKQALTEESVERYFSHYLAKREKNKKRVTRYDLPGINGLNFVLDHVLDGGGMASLRPDPLGKAFAQMLLDFKIEDMPDLDEI